VPNETYGEAGASSGPMGSVPFGQGQQLEKVQQAGNQAAAQGPSAPPAGGAPAPAAGAAPPQPGQPDAQPPPEGAQPFQQVEPLVLPRPPQQIIPFGKFIADAARHPAAGSHLKALARMIGANQ
jgi:hypothetical protein